MLSVAIMAIALGAVFSAQAGSIKMAQRARKLSFAALLGRCKMGEIEEDIAKKGLPASFLSEHDECCKDAPIEGFTCKWEVVPIVLPDAMFGGEEDDKGKPGSGQGANGAGPGSGSDGKSKGGLTGLLGAATAALTGKKPGDTSSTDLKDASVPDVKDPKSLGKPDASSLQNTDPQQFLAGGQGSGGGTDGIATMAMQFVYPVLKPAFESQIRRASITVTWSEGSAEKTFELTQYVVAEQAVPLATDPNNPNGLPGASGLPGGLGTQSTPAKPGGSGLTR
jgi:hypothetical protein